jgi:hypothetical protein
MEERKSMSLPIKDFGPDERSAATSGQGIVAMQQATELENQRPAIHQARAISWFIFVCLLAFFLIVLLATHPGGYSFSPDVYWHVATGRQIWETGSLPRIDEFSHTFQGHPWITENWLAELVLFGAYSLDGWRGVALLAFCLIAATYALQFLVLARKLRFTVAIGTAVVAFAFSTGHFSARPQIFVDSLMILWAAGLVKAVEDKTSPPLVLLPVMVLWANIHASFTFGLTLVIALAAEAVLSSSSSVRIRTAKNWAIFFVLAAAGACLTPYGYEPILHTFEVFRGNEALPYIEEWRPATFQGLGINELTLLGLLFLALHYGVRISAWRLLIVLGLVYLMMSHVRLMSHFALLTPILLATPLSRQFPFLRLSSQIAQDPGFFSGMERIARRGTYAACGLVLFGIVGDAVWGGEVPPKAYIAPAGAVDYIYREHLTGNIYNPYNFGGYLIFRRIKTFVDGRTEQLFVDGFTTRHSDAVNKHPRTFLAFLAEYNVTIALVVPDSIEAQELTASDAWEKVYSDEVSELYKQRGCCRE